MTDQNPKPNQDERYAEVENPKNSTNLSLELKWEKIKAAYQQRYPNLSGNDLVFLPEQFMEMADVIASKTERSRAEVTNEIRYWNPNSDQRGKHNDL